MLHSKNKDLSRRTQQLHFEKASEDCHNRPPLVLAHVSFLYSEANKQ
ncbi:MAG TPA: hypothetical protein VF644_02885 [Pyrinomonadaceae bacterium]